MNKEKVAPLVDSGADVPEALVKQYGMYVSPLQTIYPEKIYTDKIDITPEEVYQRLEKETPSTPLPDGVTIQAIFDKIKKTGYEKVLAVTISSSLGGTYNVVRLLEEQTEGLDVFALDIKNIGIGVGIQVIRAAGLIETGLGQQELQQKLTEEVANAKALFNVATLEYLQKGGQIGLVTSVLGNALKLNPIIPCNEEGTYYTVVKSHGRKRSLDRTFELVTNFTGEAPRFRLAVVHGAAEEEAKVTMERLEAAFPQAEEIYFRTISPALVVHTGPGLLGTGIQLLND